MASIICKCGNRITDTTYPNDIEFHVYTKENYDKYGKSDIYIYEITWEEYEVWGCPTCKRIYLPLNATQFKSVYKPFKINPADFNIGANLFKLTEYYVYTTYEQDEINYSEKKLSESPFPLPPRKVLYDDKNKKIYVLDLEDNLTSAYKLEEYYVRDEDKNLLLVYNEKMN